MLDLLWTQLYSKELPSLSINFMIRAATLVWKWNLCDLDMREMRWVLILRGDRRLRRLFSGMVERSDRAPLLDWEEVPSAEKPGGEAPPDGPSSPSGGRALSVCPGFGRSSGLGGPAPSADGCGAPPATSGAPAAADEASPPDKEAHLSDVGARDRMVKWEEKDQIVSVFVVTFNTRTGEAWNPWDFN